MLTKTKSIIERIIRGRPMVQYYIQRYRGDRLWQKDCDYYNRINVKYITYFHNEACRHNIDVNMAASSFFKQKRIQVAGASFRGPLLICLLNLTLNEKSASHTLQFALKDHVFLN